MAAPPIVDFEALLNPITADNPSGESLRYNGTYDIIEEARRSDDALAQGEWQRETKVADWSAVIETATAALTTQSKDLHIGTRLVEALVKQHGFVGLRDGLRLLRELQERFWDSLYPAIEDGDVEFRVGPLEWCNDKVPLSIRQTPLVEGGEHYSWLHWQESRTVDNLGRQNQAALEAALTDGKITGEQFDKAVAATSRAYYEALFTELEHIRGECTQLDRVVEEKFDRDAPSLRNLKSAIEDCHTLVDGIVKKKRELEPDAQLAAATSVVSVDGPLVVGTAPAVMPVPTAGGIIPLQPQDRADALRRLAAVAEYFRRHEPHSPVAYLVQRAVRWGDMSLEDWLREVINDSGVLAYVLRDTLGLKEENSN